MVCARVVFNLILNKLKSGQADTIKGKMIGAAGVRNRKRVRAPEVLTRPIPERRQPLPEDRADSFVALHVHAADFAGAVIEIEVCVKLIVFRGSGKFWRSR